VKPSGCHAFGQQAVGVFIEADVSGGFSWRFFDLRVFVVEKRGLCGIRGIAVCLGFGALAIVPLTVHVCLSDRAMPR
jgi:hypothetical protein